MTPSTITLGDRQRPLGRLRLGYGILLQLLTYCNELDAISVHTIAIPSPTVRLVKEHPEYCALRLFLVISPLAQPQQHLLRDFPCVPPPTFAGT